jgi:outer membrane protein W
MKKLLLVLTLGTIVSVSATAQDLKPFKVDVSVGYAIPGGSGAKGGVLFAIEPKYSVISQLALGLRMEGAVVARGFSGIEDETSEVDVKASASYLLTGDYYFTNNYSFRPFAGAGAGIFSIAAASVTHNGNTAAAGAGSKFGGLVRAGIEAGHFRFGIEYNIVPSTQLETTNSDKVTSKNGYIGIKFGACIGGGRK